MGGHGSGRKHRTTELVNRMKGRSPEPLTPIATDMYLPNVSNVQDFARKDRPASRFTAGSVLFADSNGVPTQDNSNLFWDDTNDRLGLNTNSPQATFHIKDTGMRISHASGAPFLDFFDDDDSDFFRLQFQRNDDAFQIKTNGGRSVFIVRLPAKDVSMVLEPLISSTTANEHIGVVVNPKFEPGGASAPSAIFAYQTRASIANNSLTIPSVTLNSGKVTLDADFTGTVTDVSDINLLDATVNGGTITNLIGVRVQNQAAGTNNWNIKSEGSSSLNEFEGNVVIGGSVKMSLVSETATYTALTTDHTILCGAGNESFTVTLPAASGVTDIIYNIKNIGTGTITVDGNAAETIDGSATAVISTQFASITIQCDGSNWHII